VGFNASLALLVWLEIATAGVTAVLSVHLPIILIAATIGVWLFYVQHQFERGYWVRNDSWTAEAAAIRGSSHLELPGVLRWFTANIGVHHIHHLGSRIPFYRLPAVLRDHPQLRASTRMTLFDGFAAARLVGRGGGAPCSLRRGEGRRWPACVIAFSGACRPAPVAAAAPASRS